MNAGPEAAGRATANRCVNGCAVDTGRSRGTRNGCERECREYRPGPWDAQQVLGTGFSNNTALTAGSVNWRAVKKRPREFVRAQRNS